MTRQKTKICLSCNQLFRGRSDARTCSERCRKRFYRAKQALVNNAKLVECSAENALDLAIGSLKSIESRVAKELLPVANTEAGFIGDTPSVAQAPTMPPPTPPSPPAASSQPLPIPPTQVQSVPRPITVPRTYSPRPIATQQTRPNISSFGSTVAPAVSQPQSPLAPRIDTVTANNLKLAADNHPPHTPPATGSVFTPTSTPKAAAATLVTQPVTSPPIAAQPEIKSLEIEPLVSQPQALQEFWQSPPPPTQAAQQSNSTAVSVLRPDPFVQPVRSTPVTASQLSTGIQGLPPSPPEQSGFPRVRHFFTRMPIFAGLSFAVLVALAAGVFALFGLLNPSQPTTTNVSFQTTDNSSLSTTNSTITLNLDTVIATGKTLTLGQLIADPATGVLLLAGDLNASGTLLASGGSSSLSNAGLTIDNNLVCTADGCTGTGAAAAAGIPATTTLQGNTFNGANQLVQLNSTGFLPALNGSNLTNLNATNIASGTISDSRLSTTVTLQGNTFNGADQLVQLTAGGILPVLSGANLTNLNASNISSGTISAGRLPANVAYLDGTGPQIFTGNNRFNGTFLSQNAADSTTAFQIQNAAGTSNLLIANTVSSRIAIGQATAAYTLDVAGDINSTTGIRVGGALLCEVGGCTAAGGSGSYIQNSTALQTAANFNVESATTTSVTGVIRALTGQTADLLQLKDQAAVNIVTIGPTGNVLIQPSTNSVTGFQVFNADATSHLIGGDTLNARVAIAKPTPPDYTLDVGGDINSTTGLRVAGNLVCSTTCTPGGGSGNYVQNGTALQTANFAIQSDLNTHVGALIRGASGQSADLLDLVAGDAGTNVVSFGASGATLFKNVTDSTTAFQIQNAAANPYFLVNTSGASISLGDTSIASTIQIGNTTGAVAQTINIGNNATALATSTVVLGSTIGASSTTIQGGTGYISLMGTSVGIGTATPGATLEVAGNLLLSKEAARTISIASSTTADTVGGALSIAAGAGFGAAAGGALNLTTGAAGATSGTSGILTLSSANNGVAGQGSGAVNINTGTVVSTAASGAISIVTGSPSGGSGSSSGAVTIGSGDCISGSCASGAVNISAGVGRSTGGTGAITIFTNTPTGTSGGFGGVSGAVTLKSNAGGTATTGTGGASGLVTISSGAGGAASGASGTGGNAANIALTTGAGGAAGTGNANGGNAGTYVLAGGVGGNGIGSGTGGAGSGFALTGGNGGTTGTGTAGAAGTISLVAGNGGIPTGAGTGVIGGSVTLTAGNGSLALAGGAVSLAGGTGGATGVGGALSLTTGAGGSASGDSGALTLLSGNTTSGTAGNISIDVGTSTASNGSILIGTAARAQTITLGNLLSSSATTIQGGSGNISISATAGTVTLQTTTSGAINITPASVDGTNIVLGTSDTVGTLLVLDTKTGAGDPTCVNGGIYYNSNISQFRGCVNGSWVKFAPSEYGYAEFTGDTKNITATTQAGADNVATTASYTYSGSETIMIHIFAPYATRGTTWIRGAIFEDSTSIGDVYMTLGGSGTGTQMEGWLRRTPAAGAHTYSFRAYVDAGTGTVQGQVGSEASGFTPAFVRVTD